MKLKNALLWKCGSLKKKTFFVICEITFHLETYVSILCLNLVTLIIIYNFYASTQLPHRARIILQNEFIFIFKLFLHSFSLFKDIKSVPNYFITDVLHSLFICYQVGSRRVIQVACLLMLLQGIFNKFGALFIIIPEPVIGGIFCVMFGMITAFGNECILKMPYAPLILIYIYPPKL